MLFLHTAVRVAVGAGRPELGRQLLQGVEARNTRDRNSVLTSRAVLAEARGELPEASAQYLEVADRWRDYGFVLEQGRALLGAGRTLMAGGTPQEGEAAASAATEIFGRLGAVRLLAEADALLQ
jgi:hypothetical protein